MVDPVLSMILASGVIAAIITAIFSIYSLHQTNRNLKHIENIKNDNTIQIFRYTKLFELNEELINIDIDINSENYMEQLLIKNNKIEKIFNKAKAILSKNYYDEISSAFQEVEVGFRKTADSIRAGKGFDGIEELGLKIKKAEDKFQEVVFLQLRDLLIKQSIYE